MASNMKRSDPASAPTHNIVNKGSSLFWLTLTLTIFAIAPFTEPGYFWGANDARHHVYFLFEYDRVFQDGIWWPRWSPDFAFGYGYPFFNIYGPFSHALAEMVLRLFRVSYTNAIEIVFALSIVGSAASMYLFVRSWLGNQAAMVSALVYVYAPYHLLDLYVRANLAESMAFVWLPCCLWTARNALIHGSFRWIVGLSISLAGLVVTSQLVTLLFAPLFGLYLLTLWLTHTPYDGTADLTLPSWLRRWPFIQSALAPGLGMIGALGLSCIFWLPMILERNDVRVDQWFAGRYGFTGNFVYFFQLFSPTWAFGISEPGPDDAFSFQIGVIPLVLATIGTLLAWRRKTAFDECLTREILVFLLVGIGSALITLEVASPIWHVPVIGSILGAAQFPWRWLTTTTLCMSILSGLIFHPAFGSRNTNLTSSQFTFPLFTVVAVIILGTYPLLRVQVIDAVEGPVSLAGLMRFQRSSDEMTGSTRWVKEIPTWSPMAEYYESQALADPEGEVKAVESKVDYDVLDYDQETGFVVDSRAHNTVMEEVWYFAGTDDRRIVFEHFYYPGWRAYLLDGEHGNPIQELAVLPEEEGTLGRMTVPVPKGEGFVLLRFEDTVPRIIGRYVSLATIVILLLAALILRIRRGFASQTHPLH